MTLPTRLYAEVTSTLADAGRDDLVQRLEPFGPKAKKDLTSTQAAEALGVSSANTVKNWLAGGHFPGAYKTAGGHWRFPREEVLAVKERMIGLRRKNEAGDLQPADIEDIEPPPLL